MDKIIIIIIITIKPLLHLPVQGPPLDFYLELTFSSLLEWIHPGHHLCCDPWSARSESDGCERVKGEYFGLVWIGVNAVKHKRTFNKQNKCRRRRIFCFCISIGIFKLKILKLSAC